MDFEPASSRCPAGCLALPEDSFFSLFFFLPPHFFSLCQRERSVCKEAQAARPEPLQINLSVKARYAAGQKMHLTFSDIIAFGTLVHLKQH